MRTLRTFLSFTLELEEKVLDPVAIAARLNERTARAGNVLIWPYKAMLQLVSGL